MISTDTLLNEINQAPPGYVIHIDPAGEWEVKGDPRRLLINASGRPQARRQQDETILEIIDQLILNDLEALRSRYGIDIFGAHLSAGLDSSLISYLLKRELGNSLRCYSLMSELASSADNPHLIERFSNAHGIITTFVDVTNEYPLGTEEDRERTVAYPRFLNPLRNLTKRVNTEIASQEVVAVFTGIGGNEAYRTDRVPLMSRFFQQEHFFFEVDAIRSQLASCLTGAAVEAILSPRRFCSRRVYPMLLAESVVRSNLVEFESYWSSGVWPVQTFTNTELLRVIRDNASGMAIASREYILKRLAGEVFLDEQFEAIGNYNAHYALMFEREFALIEDLLRNPVLDRLGLVTGDSLRRFALGDYREALVEDGSIVMLHNIVRLELFLQRNDALRLVP